MNKRYLPSGCVVTIDNTPRYLALSSTTAHTTILSTTSRTTLTQTYVNNTGTSLKEARYLFPLYDGISVVEFTCTIGSKVIKGVVKERNEAKRVFKEAVERGETAGLLEQSLSAADVFSTTLGNVPAGDDVEVDITYLGELEHDAEVDGVRFTIPTAIAPRYGHNEDENVASPPLVSVKGKIEITVDVDMGPGCAVKSVQSPSHPISVNIGTMSTDSTAEPSLRMASASLSLGSAEFEKDFVIQVISSGLGSPAALLELHPTKPNQRTIMTSLVPRFNLPVDKPEIVFVCDRSGSMGAGQRMPNLISALKIFLKSLPVGVRFNICSFGSHHSFLWPKSVEYTQESLDKAVHHVGTFSDNYGGTEMVQPMQETFKNRLQGSNLEVFLLTDGEIWDQDRLFELINDEMAASKGAIRVFTLGIGKDVSHSLIKGVARAGNGFSQVAGENEKIDKKIVRMLKGALTPHVTNYTLEIKYDKPEDKTSSNVEDDGFELVEKVMDALTIDAEDPSTATAANKSSDTKPDEPSAPISLFDPDVKDEDLEMKDGSEDLETLKASLPTIDAPRYLQTPFEIPPLFPFNRTTVYVMLSASAPTREPKSVILRGTSHLGPLELEIPITKLNQKGTTLHQLAARKAVQELEDGKGWLYHAKDSQGQALKEKWAANFSYIAKKEAVKLGVEYQVGGKWCSFVAVPVTGDESDKDPADVPQTDVDIMEADYDGVVRRSLEKKRKRRAFGGAVRNRMVSMATPMASMARRQAHLSMQSMQSTARNHGPMDSMAMPMASMERRSAPTMSRQSMQSTARNRGPMDSMFMRMADTSSPEESGDAQGPEPEGLSGLAALQTFIGSWKWSSQLEHILNITQDQATKAIVLPEQENVADVLATLCAVMYLKKKMANDKDSWELMTDKAEDWLQDQTGQTMEQLEVLVENAKLFI